jgi:hypothetical protein
MKQTRLPRFVLRAALGSFEKLIERGREQCRRSVTDLVNRELEPLAPQIAEQIWQNVKPLLGRQHLAGRTLALPAPRSPSG